jgi:hypothetical protein
VSSRAVTKSVCKRLIHYFLKPCSEVDSISPHDLASMRSSTETSVCCEPTEAYPSLMMKTLSCPQVIFPEGFDERAAFEAPLKGWLRARVESEDGCRYAVYFSDPIRLQQDLAEEVKLGRPCFAEPGLIILPEVTVEAIQDAVEFLWEQGFFAYLKADPGEALEPTTTATKETLRR